MRESVAGARAALWRSLKKSARFTAPGAVVLLAWLGAVAFQSTAIGTRQEQNFYDRLFKLRGPLSTDLANTPITVLAVDETTFEQFKKPLVFWQGDFAAVIGRLVEAGASVVGMDFLFWDVSEWQPDESDQGTADDVLRSAILDEQRALAAAVLVANLEGPRVVLGYRGDDPRGTQLPRRLSLAAGEGGLGFVNLTTDSDDFVRRQVLYAPTTEGGEAASFASALIESHTGRPVEFPSVPGEPRTLLINYRGLEVFPRVSFWKAVEAIRDGDEDFFGMFKDRIVLIGEVADEDRHPTPLYYWVDRDQTRDKARTAGVLIHANTIATVLEGDFIRRLPDYAQFAVSLLVVAVTALIGFRSGSLRVVMAAGLTALFAALFVSLVALLFARGVYLYLAGPMAGLFLAGAGSMAANYMLEGREKRRLRNLFKRYVDDTVIEQILTQPGLALTGERKRIAVLFSDIRNFTGRSEGLSPEDLVRRLNDYFERMVRIILHHRGTVDKFIGDGIMAIFGAPLEDPEAALNSVRAGQAMLVELDRLNRDWGEDGFEPIQVGIGIHYGEAVVGNIGSPEKMEYTAIGDVVNTASRIEGLNKILGTEFLISGETHDAVASEIAAERLPDATVKGKARAVRVYRVGGAAAGRQTPPA